jgi:aryl-alcohol dehydrogenase-like predicted oxidoreductase
MSLEKRPLGNTGIQVSSLGLGTVKFGRNQEVKYPANFTLPTDRDIEALLDLAQELGFNLLDTAPAYGSSEQRIGRLLKNRDDWVLSTKVGEEFTTGKSFFDFSAEHARRSVERSLRDMRTECLDIVLIHSDGDDLKILNETDCLPTLLKMREQGLIRAIGMSTKTVAGGLRAVELLDAVMATYNPSYTDDRPVIEAAYAAGKGVLLKKALNSGHDALAGASQTASNLRAALALPGVSSAIVGTINPTHLRANAEAAG